MNQDSYIASPPISQLSFFKEVCWLILASSQRMPCGYIKLAKFDITKKKFKNSISFKIERPLPIDTKYISIEHHSVLVLSAFAHRITAQQLQICLS